jgi:hypothetical protein
MRGELIHMSLITPEENGGPDKDLVRVREHYERAIDAFQHMTREAEAGEFDPDRETNKTIKTLSNATDYFIKEKQRIDASLDKQAGIAGGYAIDFDAARREIERRISCLRAERGG